MKNKYELIVVGGGFAGFAAAVSAAKEGVDVLLIERNNCLGGAAANALVMPFMKYWTNHPETKERKYLCGNLFLEITDELKKLSGIMSTMSDFDEEILKLVLNRMAKKYGVTLLFHATVTEAVVQDGKVESVKVYGKSGTLEFYADHLIDATGDAELCALSGCEFKLGREADKLCQPMTLCFRLGGVNKTEFRKNRAMIDPLYRQFQEKGLIKNPRENLLIFDTLNDGVLHINSTRIIKKDPTDPFEITEAEIEAREQVFELYGFLKDNIPGFEHARVLSTAMHIGIRESRKIVGEYVLTEQDLLSLARFDDAIAHANYAIDIHNPEGCGTHWHEFKSGEWYEIPYRCLIPKGMKNLLAAGRCISSTHEAQASYRIMPFCCELGQAAGCAVAVAKEDGKSLHGIDVKKLQKKLRVEGFVI
ncbi:MAG: FAD-dependent oxidoreductase [Oscillospiraceae bacterium]|nr:FAD-dependent oxidoreductase [Oscillospiraceae bacterium]